MEFYPDILTFENGTKVKTPEDFALRRKEMLKILSEHAYGYIPETPSSVSAEITEETRLCSGHADFYRMKLSAVTKNGKAEFPFHIFIPRSDKKVPLIVMMNFTDSVFDKYYPAEEITDHGFALAVIYYNNVSTDDGDFATGIAPLFPRKGKGTDASKISIWAWAMSRVIDLYINDGRINSDEIAVAGHSRLGKTALWCGANDERVKYVFCNNSGCMGDSLEQTRREGSENHRLISERFPFWFCDNFNNDVMNGRQLPFDQHFLMACCAPRYVFTAAAQEDDWADQYSQQLCCAAASPAWNIYGKRGFSGTEEPANAGDSFSDGEICFHLRSGCHYFGRGDWLEYLSLAEKYSGRI